MSSLLWGGREGRERGGGERQRERGERETDRQTERERGRERDRQTDRQSRKVSVKMNRFHMYLADDEGWRLEIPGLPELTTVSMSNLLGLRKMKETERGNGWGGGGAGGASERKRGGG